MANGFQIGLHMKRKRGLNHFQTFIKKNISQNSEEKVLLFREKVAVGDAKDVL